MVKNRINEKICRDCRRQIIGRRSDAIICKDCRREAQAQSSQKIKEKEKEKRIWRKVEASGVKGRIEYQKAQNELRKILNEGSTDEKLRAISVMPQLQNTFTNLLEKNGKKPIVPEKIEFVKTAKSINQDIKEYQVMFTKLTEEEREKLKMTLLDKIENSQ